MTTSRVSTKRASSRQLPSRGRATSGNAKTIDYWRVATSKAGEGGKNERRWGEGGEGRKGAHHTPAGDVDFPRQSLCRSSPTYADRWCCADLLFYRSNYLQSILSSARILERNPEIGSTARFPLPDLTARVDGWRLVETHARQHGPCWRIMETGHPSTRAVNSGRQLG